MVDVPDIIQVESDSKPGRFYQVDLRVFTCTCPFGQINARKLAVDDPFRLCKHLIRTFIARGIPQDFEEYRADIIYSAKRNRNFTERRYPDWYIENEYQIDLENLLCSCYRSQNVHRRYRKNDIRRLCSHLIFMLVETGNIPKELEPHRKRILQLEREGRGCPVP